MCNMLPPYVANFDGSVCYSVLKIKDLQDEGYHSVYPGQI